MCSCDHITYMCIIMWLHCAIALLFQKNAPCYILNMCSAHGSGLKMQSWGSSFNIAPTLFSFVFITANFMWLSLHLMYGKYVTPFNPPCCQGKWSWGRWISARYAETLVSILTVLKESCRIFSLFCKINKQNQTSMYSTTLFHAELPNSFVNIFLSSHKKLAS